MITIDRPQLRLTEAEFQRQVIEVAHIFGWRVAHFRPAMTQRGTWITPVQADGKGFPDLVMVRGERLIFAELKQDKARLTAEQIGWLDELSATKAEVYTWRPSTFDFIMDCLR